MTANRLQRPPAPPDTVPLDIPIYRYRVLFSDGQLFDFLAPSDHSGYRELMLNWHFGPKKGGSREDPDASIAGIAHLGQEYVHTPIAR